MNQLFSYVLICPSCQHEGLIETYARGELLRLLELGYPMMSRCVECGAYSDIRPEARAQILRVLASSFAVSLGQALSAQPDRL